jgi:hypothetical protein
LRAQIKYIRINKRGVIEIITSTVVNRKKVSVDLSQTDLWVVYCPNTDENYYISSVELLGKKTICLRVTEPKVNNNDNIHYAKNYTDLNKVWHIL